MLKKKDEKRQPIEDITKKDELAKSYGITITGGSVHPVDEDEAFDNTRDTFYKIVDMWEDSKKVAKDAHR